MLNLFGKNNKKKEDKISLKKLAGQFTNAQRNIIPTLAAPAEDFSLSDNFEQVDHVVRPTSRKSLAVGSLDAFEEALMGGNLEKLESLIQEKEKQLNQSIANFVDKDGATLLHRAAKYEHEDIIDFLVRKKSIPINCEDNISATPLFYSVAHGVLKSCAILLSNGADPNVRDKYEQFPLLIAITRGYWQLVDMLLIFKGDIHFKGVKGKTALHHCAHEGDLAKVQLLLTKFKASIEKKDRNDDTVLSYALKHPHIVVYLLQYMIDNHGEEKLVKLLRQTNSRGVNVLHQVVEDGLIKSFFFIVSMIPESQILSVLNEKNTREQQTIVHISVNSQNAEMLKILIASEEVDVNIQDKNGDTPLHLAISSGKTQMIQMLLSGGAKLGVKNNQGLTQQTLAQKNNIELKAIAKSKKKVAAASTPEVSVFSIAANSLVVDWNSNFALGIELMDKDHQVLIDIINELLHALANTDTEGWMIVYLMSQLIEVAEHHFKHEEELMEKHEYTENYAALHKEEHHKFIEDLKRGKQQFVGEKQAWDEAALLGLLTSWVSWLTTHILKYDKFLSEFIKKKEHERRHHFDPLSFGSFDALPSLASLSLSPSPSPFSSPASTGHSSAGTPNSTTSNGKNKSHGITF